MPENYLNTRAGEFPIVQHREMSDVQSREFRDGTVPEGT